MLEMVNDPLSRLLFAAFQIWNQEYQGPSPDPSSLSRVLARARGSAVSPARLRNPRILGCLPAWQSRVGPKDCRPLPRRMTAISPETPGQAPVGRTTTQGSWRWLRRVQAFAAALADRLARRAR